MTESEKPEPEKIKTNDENQKPTVIPEPEKPEKPEPKQETIEIISKKKEKKKLEETHIKMYKYNKCPFCENEELHYDPKRKIYYCPNCERAFR